EPTPAVRKSWQVNAPPPNQAGTPPRSGGPSTSSEAPVLAARPGSPMPAAATTSGPVSAPPGVSAGVPATSTRPAVATAPMPADSASPSSDSELRLWSQLAPDTDDPTARADTDRTSKRRKTTPRKLAPPTSPPV